VPRLLPATEHTDFSYLAISAVSSVRGGRRRVEDMCYERRRAEACVDESAHHACVFVRRKNKEVTRCVLSV
jgi:hypothetical protein